MYGTVIKNVDKSAKPIHYLLGLLDCYIMSARNLIYQSSRHSYLNRCSTDIFLAGDDLSASDLSLSRIAKREYVN